MPKQTYVPKRNKTTRNFVYEVSVKDSKKILEQPPASKTFLEECKKVALKYRRNK